MALALLFIGTGVVRCPCGGWTAVPLGATAGTMLYALLARALPRLQVAPLMSAALWASIASAAAAEVVWRGWLTTAAVPPEMVPYVVAASIAGFAVVHLPHQGGSGVAVHTLTGATFAATVLAGGLFAAIAAHVTYNVWILMARARIQEEDHAVTAHRR